MFDPSAHPLAVASVYALSFWHYGLYWLAYRYGRLNPKAFRVAAVSLKTLALLAFAWAYAPHALSDSPLAVAVPVLVALGFGLNAWAAAMLGSERTYYGYELTDSLYERVTRFPYSVTAHPMLLGNVLAFSAPLLNPGFRAEWWPLAVAHVLLNLGLLAMESWVTPMRGYPRQAERRPA